MSLSFQSKLTAVLILSGTIYCSLVQSQTSDLASLATDCPDSGYSQQKSQIEFKVTCAKLYQTLRKNGLLETLESPLPKQLSPTQLQLLQTATKLTDKLELLDESGLDALLASIYEEKKQDQTVEWWKQFLNWLSGFKPEKYESEFNWLLKFLEAITPSERTARFMMYGSFTLIILLAIGLVIWELYLSGVFSRKRHGSKKQIPGVANSINPVEKKSSFAEIKQLAPAVQGVALLKSVISQLMENDTLPRNSALTNIEFKQCLQTSHSSSLEPFSQLLKLVEPALYGDETLSNHAIALCWQYAEQMFER